MVGTLTERLFVAVAPPDEVRAAIHEWRADLDLPGRLVPPANLHITLRFIGPVEAVGRDRLVAALDEADLGAGFRLRLDGLGAFPSKRRATVAWVAVEGATETLTGLADTVDDVVADAGLGHEERPFRPHLTVSRIRPPEDLRGLDPGPLGARFAVGQIVLYRSNLEGGMVFYEPLERFSLR